MKKQHLFGLALLIIFGLYSCTPPTNDAETQTTSTDTSVDAAKSTPLGQASVTDDDSEKNILQIAAGSADHSTLVAAVQAAGIEHILANNGPLTIFAPTNDAFAALPEGTVETLLKPENKKQLARILTFHAAPAEYKGKLFKDGMSLYMATGHYVKVERNGDDIVVNGANIIGTVEATNGVIHVIDQVMLPPDKK